MADAAASAAVSSRADGSLLAIIGDEDTVTGFLLAGVGNVDLRRNKNFLVVDSKTPTRLIEDTFKEFTNRDDISVVLINQSVANTIRYALDSYNRTLPAILEIPSKDHPYDPSQDTILSRVKHMFGGEA